LVSILKQFAKLQRIATLASNGALRSSPTDLLDAHSGLLPMGLLLKKICLRAIVRISMLPASNPVNKQLASYYHCPAKTHPTNIQNLLKIFNYNPKLVKKITPHSRHVNHHLPFTMNTPVSKDEALRQELVDSADI